MAEVYEGDDDYIFVSYSHKDSERVLPIIESLRHAGYRVWYDAGIKPGFEWTEYIAKHVASCRCMLALITPSSVESRHCNRELYYAFSQEKDIMLVYLEDAQLTPGMEMYYDISQAMKRSNYSSQDSFVADLLKADILKSCLFKDAVRRKDTRQQTIEELVQMAESLLGRYDVGKESLQPTLLALRLLPDDEKDKETEWLIGRLMERINWLEYERERSVRNGASVHVAEKEVDAVKVSDAEAWRDGSSDSQALTPAVGLSGPSPVKSANPRVFISYSWTSEEYQQEVIDLAVSLMRDGVEVVLDEWDLEPGQDKLSFMERCVSDGTIQKVLMLCDRAYADKANGRWGGVGDETSIITPEVYGRTDQTKFVPVLMERGADGTEYLPAYLSSRKYIDLSDRAHKKQYENLLRSIYGAPRRPKPKLGTPPKWLNDSTGGEEEQAPKAKVGREVTETKVAKDVQLSNTLAPKGFAEYSWVELKAIADMIAAARTDSEALGIAKAHGLVDSEGKLRGDTKPVTLTNGRHASIRIAGFRHDDRADGKGKAGITFEFADVPDTHAMNPDSPGLFNSFFGTTTNSGGWRDSNMRKYLNGSFRGLLPSELRSQIVQVRKRTNNRGGDVHNDTSTVTNTEDELWLLSMSEIYGKLSDQRSNVPAYPIVYDAEGTQYKLYADQRVSTTNCGFCKKGRDGADSEWWLRSPNASYSDCFYVIFLDGGWNRWYNAFLTRGVSPGFCF